MALRDQPYLPLYIQDFMTDEKLIECSAECTGVYIRIMCLMHKSDQYGKILLKQKYKQPDKQTKNFAKQLARSMPYDLLVIENSLDELINEGVLILDGDIVSQKRMIKDNNISEIRRSAGTKGAEVKKEFAKAKLKANPEAKPTTNSEYEYEDENVIKRNIIPPKIEWVKEYCLERKNDIDPGSFIDFYQSKGWLVGKTKMKDWEASIRTWEMTNKSEHKDKKQSAFV